MNNKRVPVGVEALTSHVEETSFTWIIKDIKEMNFHHRPVPNRRFEAGGFYWDLSLCLSADGKQLLGVVTLLEPEAATAAYYIRFHVVTPLGTPILRSPFSCEHPVVSSRIEGKSSDKVEWEIKFKDNTIILDHNLFYNNSFHLLVEMTVFTDVTGNGN